MKRMVLSLAIILCVILTLPSFAYADAITRAESLCCALAFDMDGTPVAAIVLSELCAEDIMSDGLESLLSKKPSGDVTTDGAVCCVPNPPTRQLVVYFHIPSSNSKQCKGSKENWWQCTKCGAVIRKSATIQLGYHKKAIRQPAVCINGYRGDWGIENCPLCPIENRPLCPTMGI